MIDLGLLPHDSIARRVDRETFVLLGGTAALLMQVAHPLVAAGVAAHSDFRGDPLGRLVRTLDTTLAAVFGDTATAKAALARIDRRHGAVHGVAADGRRYAARDPRLGLWVQCTLVLTSLRLYELVRPPLTRDERQRYWDEGKVFARALGIGDDLLPPTIDDLAAYERRMLVTEVKPDATSIAVGRAVLRPLRGVPGFVHRPLDAFTAGLLPPPLRAPFGLRYGAPERVAFEAVAVGLRLALPLLPEGLTVVPQARRYERRMRS